ncbi:bifunctional SulP family inorganic anion transporter/carbonic anhydrase [Mycobacterium sp. ITM-2016-00316]|uniref:SulP family inorganic anion transporter n=1 Tax=Mycobacterium sp. ITM-2016-00316 TaxID=2099695 RepID=UPI001E28AD85|nr:bifunctional SulP family inorganic anion transporter/carbonic anhydrase [Mycobacterium sp. ITM-2016-00316]WNG84198.1 bifunctional SulP family inorganic anion transporter/carbonic anhydrase [Mycobacterium sp. ITM-2016-00316]
MSLPSKRRHVNPLLHTVFRYDVPASLVVFLVALPLSIGIAVASGAPVVAGLIAAIVGGIVCAVVGGSPLQVSGPAAGLTVVVAELVAQFGWKATCAITAAAGVLQVLLGLSRIARAALAIAPIVVHAMLAGIGITIALQQVHVLLGGGPRGNAWENLVSLPGQLAAPQWSNVLIGGLVIAVMLSWRFTPAAVRAVPGALVAIVLATALNYLPGLGTERIVLDESVVDAIGLPEMPQGSWSSIALAVLTVALIASVESLLSATAVDKMHNGARTDFNRELVGQGAANVSSGLLGGLPVTGVIVRSTANVGAGAKTRASAALHGVWLLLFSVLLVDVVEMIPMAALAGLLIVIGVQLVKLAHIDLARRTGELLIYGITLGCVVFLNLLEGVLIGLVLAIALAAWRIVRVSIVAEDLTSRIGAGGPPRWHVAITGSCSFLALPRLNSVLSDIPHDAQVFIDLNVDYLDHAALDALQEWITQHRDHGAEVTVTETGTARMEFAHSQPPRRHTEGRRVVSALRMIWPAQLAGGVDRFSNGLAPLLRARMESAGTEHDPHTMLVSCADARILPNLITDSAPGEMLNVRNVGNLVGDDLSVESALSYALGRLSVRTVVICGHSGCDAMHDLMHEAAEGSVGRWLDHGADALAAFRAYHPVAAAAADAGFTGADQLSVVNVAVQVRAAQQHPQVAARLAEGTVSVVGLFLDLATARLYLVSADSVTEIDQHGATVTAATPK